MSRDKRIRVLFIQPTCVFGGIERLLLTIVQHLDRARFEPHVVFFEDGPLVDDIRQADARATVFPTTHLRHPGNTTATILRLAYYIRTHRIDIVHCNGPKSQIYGAIAAKITGRPNFYWIHHIPSTELGHDVMSDLALLLPTTARFANSSSSFLAIKRHRLVRRMPQILWCGLDLDPYRHAQHGEIPRIMRRPIKNVLSIGRIQSWKGQHVLIQAAHLLKQRRNDVRFTIVGSPSFEHDRSYYDAVLDLTRQLMVEDVVTFVPHTSNVQAIYRDSDIVAHTSILAEPFGLVLIEALAHGRPVVATDMGGPRDITASGTVGGLLVPPNDPTALAEAITALLDRPDYAVKLAQAGRDRVQQLYSLQRMIADLETLYHGAAG